MTVSFFLLYRLSVIGYRLSVIGYRLSVIEILAGSDGCQVFFSFLNVAAKQFVGRVWAAHPSYVFPPWVTSYPSYKTNMIFP
jgi:hypothetical protein